MTYSPALLGGSLDQCLLINKKAYFSFVNFNEDSYKKEIFQQEQLICIKFCYINNGLKKKIAPLP